MILSTYIFGPFGGGEDIQQTRVDLIQGARLVSDENWILRVTQNLSDGFFTCVCFFNLMNLADITKQYWEHPPIGSKEF